MKKPIFYLKETNEYLYNDLTKEKPIKYVFYKKEEEEIKEKEKQFFCYKIDINKKYNFEELMKSTYKQYKEIKPISLIESIEKNIKYSKYNNKMYPEIKQLPVKYIISSIYKTDIIIYDSEMNYYKYEIKKEEEIEIKKKQKSNFFLNYKIENSTIKIENKKTEFKINFNKTKFNFKNGLKNEIFKEKYNKINSIELINNEKQKKEIIITLFNDPCISKTTCIEINIKRKIISNTFNEILNQLEVDMKNLINYKTNNWWITKLNDSLKSTNLLINSSIDLFESFNLNSLEILKNLFDEFCLKNKICKNALKNFKDCNCKLFLDKIYKKGIYNLTFYFDLSESFSIYFFKRFSKKDFIKFIPKNLKYNLLSFINKIFCKEYINEIYREYLSFIFNNKQINYQLINYKLFINSEIIINSNLELMNKNKLNELKNELKLINLKVKKVYKTFYLINEENYLMEEIKNYEKILNGGVLIKNKLKLIKKHQGKLPKGFINLYFKLNPINKKDDNYLLNKEIYFNLLSFLKKIENSNKFNIQLLLDFINLKGFQMNIFFNSIIKKDYKYEFCKCGNYKLKDSKCKK